MFLAASPLSSAPDKTATLRRLHHQINGHFEDLARNWADDVLN